MTSPLHPTFRKRVADSIEQIITQQVVPWAFLNSGHPMRVTRFDGRQISYQGGGFEGSPRDVFWGGYIEPFLEHLCVTEMEAAVSMAKERHVDARELLPELQNMLMAGVTKIYERMAKTDQALLGKGFPEKIQRKRVDREIERMRAFISERVNAELAMWKPRSSVELWYEKNKFWVWAIGILLTLAGLALKFV